MLQTFDLPKFEFKIGFKTIDKSNAVLYNITPDLQLNLDENIEREKWNCTSDLMISKR